MTLEELVREVPELEEYTRYMPEELWQRCSIRVYPPGTIIHQKDYKLEYFGLIAKGEHRVINEFQNGNVYMIEKNEPVAELLQKERRSRRDNGLQAGAGIDAQLCDKRADSHDDQLGRGLYFF